MKYVLYMIIGYVLFGVAEASLIIALFSYSRILFIVGVICGFGAIYLTTIKINLLRDIFIWANRKYGKETSEII